MVDFLKYRWLYLLISFTAIGIGLFSIVSWGFHYSIDFIGGTNLQYLFDRQVSLQGIKKIVADNKIGVIDIKQDQKTIFMRTKAIDDKKENILKTDIEKKLKVRITVLLSETVGPTLGRETISKTLIASLIGILGILIYMSFAFKNFRYGSSAILAMIHDFLVVIGSYSLLSHFFNAEFDTLFVTAILTTMSFSVHDTIVVFDKIREYTSEEGKGSIEYHANKALTETMVRSFNNSMTIVYMLLALVLLGGTTIRFFIVTLLIGTITGTYSSPFIATPILVWWEKKIK